MASFKISPEVVSVIESSLSADVERASVGVNEATVFPCSLTQRQLWLLDQLAPGDASLNVSMRWQLDGNVSKELLEAAFAVVIGRHEVLRTCFIEAGGEPLQKVQPTASLEISIVDLTSYPEPKKSAEADRISREEARRPFRLTQAPLIGAQLIHMNVAQHILLVTAHHIVFDGWSIGILSEEIGEICRAIAKNESPSLPPLPLQYGDYSRWQQAWLSSDALHPLNEYWTRQLAGFKYFEVRPDHKRTPSRAVDGNIESVLLSRSLTDAMQELGASYGATFYVTALTALMAILQRITGETDICVGAQVAGRNEVELEGLIGCFVNTVLVRSDVSGNPLFCELLTRVRDVVEDVLSHSDMPTERLIEIVRPERDPNRNPLISVNFIFQRAFTRSADYDVFKLTGVPAFSPGAIYDLVFFMVERSEGWRFSCEHNTELFEAHSVRRFLSFFERVFECVSKSPNVPISELPLLGPIERSHVLVDWNNTNTDYPRNSTVHELFELQVDRIPDAPAIILGEQHLTYAELNRRANKLANYLIERGVGQEVLVAIYMRRSLEMLVAILGVLKAGGGYVPLNPADPADRINFMVDDTNVALVLTQQELLSKLGEIVSKRETVLLDSDWDAIARMAATRPKHRSGPLNVAYVMYTSGSTGRPKGVVVEHRSIARLVHNTDYCHFGPQEVFLQLAPISFDASTFEIWGALLNGGRLAVMPADDYSATEIGRAIRKHGVTTLWLTAGLFQIVIEERLDDLRGLRQLLAGGDVLSPRHIQLFLERFPDCALINGYGPTENTTFTCCHRARRGVNPNDSVPIGRPISNTRVYILDQHLRPVPIGATGDLYASGDGLARCYLNRPDLTAERFLASPFEAGSRLYKTGDLARYRSDGEIEFLGRADNQVKIRGFRIEPSEIEAVLKLHPEIREAAVIVETDDAGDKRLIAYLQHAVGSPGLESDARHWLQQRLPPYMIPSAFVAVGIIPLTANGKIDRRALPAQGEFSEFTADYVAPRTMVESILAEVWSDVLRIDHVGVHDDFFQLGGHSLLAVSMAAKIQRRLGKKLELSKLLVARTIEQLAAYLEKTTLEELHHLVSLREVGAKPPLFCIHGGDGHLLNYRDMVAALPGDQPIYGLHASELTDVYEPETVEQLADKYLRDVQKVQEHGPYQLCGMSFGGLVAYQMATRLIERGEHVGVLALLDTGNPYYYRNLSPEKRLQFRRAYLIDRLAKYGRNLKTGQLEMFTRDARHFLTGRLKKLMWSTTRSVFRVMKRPLPKFARSNLQGFAAAAREFVPNQYPGRVILFRAEGRTAEYGDDVTLGWSSYARDGVTVHHVPGDHLTIMSAPNVVQLVECLQLYLVNRRSGVSKPRSDLPPVSLSGHE